MNLKEHAKKLKTDIPTVFLVMKRKDTPVIAKIMASVTVAYALSPLDLIPDFIPVLGYFDDVILLPALVRITMKLIPEEIWKSCRSETENLWSDGKPKKWYYAIPIVFIWLILVYLIVRRLWFYSR